MVEDREDRVTAPVGGSGGDGSLSRRRLVRLTAAGVAGLAATASVAGVLAQGTTPEPEPEPDPEADPEAEETEAAEDGTPAAGGTPVGSAGELTVYSGRNEELIGGLVPQIESGTGVDLSVRYASTGELAATILDEGENTPAGLFLAQDAGALGLLAQEGRFRPLPQELLDRVDPRFRSPDGLWVGVSGRARVLVVNTDLADPATLPASVLELTDPRWRGQVGWAPENASFQSFVTAMRRLLGDDRTRTWLEEMIANEAVGFGDSNGAIVRAVGAGEIAAGLVNHYYLYEVQQEDQTTLPLANHFFAAGDPGALVNVAGVGILADTDQAEQAEVVADFLLREPAQTYFAQETFEYPLIPGVPTAEGLPPLAEIESPDVDLTDLADLAGTRALLAEAGLI